MFDIKKVEEEAKLEVAAEAGAKAKREIKAKLQAINAAKAVVSNLEREYGILLKTIAE